MAELRLESLIDEPREVCFALLRDPAVLTDATVSGPFSLGQIITFQSRWLGRKQNLKVKVVKFDPPSGFVDEMTEGKLQSFIHIHELEDFGGATRLVDIVRWSSPFGILGKIFDELVLRRRIRRIVTERNAMLVHVASVARTGM